ncbi:MAG: hypothetical protein SGI88_06245 [Candidatus Hydrogenedentes bacterium]|nr:hypothetical protein [Candidatus Hydrogenedentota bacterium]
MRKWLGLVPVLFVVLLTRAHGIAEESVWYDEAVSVVLLDESTLAGFLDASRDVDKLKVPLYFVLEYAWWHGISKSVTGLRWLSVFIALGTAAVLYAFTLRLWGIFPAVVAALCFALSKPFLYHGQEIRMYGLMYLLALGSWFALFAATRGQRRAWHVNALLNLLLINTQLLAAFSFLAQFVFIVANDPRAWRRYVAWVAAQGAIVLTILPWIWRFTPYEEAVAWIVVPPPSFLVESFLFVLPGTKFDCIDPLEGPRWWGALAFGALALSLAACALYRARVDKQERTAALMLAIWCVVPPLAMFAASYVAVPCYVDRYALYAAFPLFMLIGRGLAISPPTTRAFCAISLLALGIFNVLGIERPMRPVMAEVADLIRFHAEEGDRIVTRGMGYEYSLSVYYKEAWKRWVDFSVPLRRSVRDVEAGTRTWFVFNPLDPDWERWMRHLNEGIEKGRVQTEIDSTTHGPQPIRVMLLTPTGETWEGARPRAL